MRVGLVGLDSSHADQIVGLLGRRDLGAGVALSALAVPRSPWAADLRAGRADELVRAYEDACRAVAEDGDRALAGPLVAEGPPDGLLDTLRGRVDAVVVADRDGRAHAAHAAPFLRAGIPVLVDKPLALDAGEAHALVALAESSGALLTSFSPLRWHPAVREAVALAESGPRAAAIVVNGPVVAGSAHGGLAFYAVHAVEVALAVARGGVVDVRRIDHDGRVVLDITTERDVARVVLAEPVAGEQASFSVSVALDDDRWVREIELGSAYLLPGLEVFCSAVRARTAGTGSCGPGAWPVSGREMVEAVRVLEALR